MKKMYITIALLYGAILLLQFPSCSCEKQADGAGGGVAEPPAGWVGELLPDEVQVQGDLIDIRIVGNPHEPEAFPQNADYVFGEDAVAACGGPLCCAVSLIENPGPLRARAGSETELVIASDCPDLQAADWVSTDAAFRLKDVSYYLHRYVGREQENGVEIPRPASSSHSCMVMASKITVNNVKNFGDCIIAESSSPRATSKINNVNIIITPDGNYLASCTGAGGVPGPVMFRSSDKGQTWEKFGTYDVSVNRIMNMYSFFIHDGSLYMMGLGDRHTNLYICRSDDNGMTWTVPSDREHGLLLEGVFHSAQVPVLLSGGRLWRSCEMYAQTMRERYPFVLSAAEGSNLLDASNWIVTNKVTDTVYKVNGRTVSGFTEGNMVEGPDGVIYNFLRSNCTKDSGFGTRLFVTGTTSLGLAPVRYCVNFPGGGKKFTMRYDPVSKHYWALTNPDVDYPADGKLRHAGMADNLSHSLIRNRLSLLKSPDLVKWTVADNAVLFDPDPYFHGFQYCDWVVDGDDLICVIRVACPEPRGLPIRQHDANRMVFTRIRNFRNK